MKFLASAVLCAAGLLLVEQATANANVEVTVTDSGGTERVGGATVCLLDTSNDVFGDPNVTAAAGGNAGVARFNQVPNGTYRIVAHADAYVGIQTDSFQVDDTNIARSLALQPGDPADGPTCAGVEPPPPILGGPQLPDPLGGVDLSPAQLVITDLRIADGDDVVNGLDVSLDWRIEYLDVPFQYRIGASVDFGGAEAGWTDLDSVEVLSEGASLPVNMATRVTHMLDDSPGRQTRFVQLRVRDDPQRVSNVLAASVVFQRLVEVIVPAGDAFEFARNNGWDFSYTGATFLINNCAIFSTESSVAGMNVLTLETRRALLGFLYWGVTGCNFTVFDGRELNPPWRFVSATVVAGESGLLGGGGSCGGVGNTAVNQQPAEGDEAIPFNVTVASDNICFAAITGLVLLGPEGEAWTSAFSN